LYQINKNFGCIITLYYYWGKYQCKLTDIIGNTLWEATCEFDNSTPKATIISTVHAIDEMLSHAQSELKSIGIGIPGAVLPDGKTFAIPKIDAWEGFDLGEALLERYGVPIFVENDVKLSAVGYYQTFLKDDFENIAYIYAGNGMGSAIIINKKLYRGSTNFSGEIGFMAPLDGENTQHDYTLEGGYLEKKLKPLICIDYNEKKKYDERTKEILVSFFTAVAANFTAIINPAAIVFGGEAFEESLIEEIRLRLVSYSPSLSIPQFFYDGSGTSGIDGLVLVCIGGLTTGIQIVQNGGV
jgi:predicted NBD/HSP70 family sugar kinase